MGAILLSAELTAQQFGGLLAYSAVQDKTANGNEGLEGVYTHIC